jgi:hypothetical protein
MAVTSIRTESTVNNPVREALGKFRIAGCAPLSGTGRDAPNDVLPMIYSLATLLDMGHRRDENGEAALENANPELLACAFDAIAHLAAFALFSSDQA